MSKYVQKYLKMSKYIPMSKYVENENARTKWKCQGRMKMPGQNEHARTTKTNFLDLLAKLVVKKVKNSDSFPNWFFRFHREDVLSKLLSQIETSSSSCSGFKIVPSYVAPDLASAIRRHVSQSLRQRKGPVPCYYISELATYTLPPGE